LRIGCVRRTANQFNNASVFIVKKREAKKSLQQQQQQQR
jgi:hypothetical protein